MLEESHRIDAQFKPDERGMVALCIIDAGVTADPEQRLAFLTKKLDSYAEAIVSGKLRADYPHQKPRAFYIRIACSRRPTPQMHSITNVYSADGSISFPVTFEEFPEGAWSAPESSVEEQPAERNLYDKVTLEATYNLGVYVKDKKPKEFCAVILGCGTEVQTVEISRDTMNAGVLTCAEDYIRNLPAEYTITALIFGHQKGFSFFGKKGPRAWMMVCECGKENAILLDWPIHSLPLLGRMVRKQDESIREIRNPFLAVTRGIGDGASTSLDQSSEIEPGRRRGDRGSSRGTPEDEDLRTIQQKLLSMAAHLQSGTGKLLTTGAVMEAGAVVLSTWADEEDDANSAEGTKNLIGSIQERAREGKFQAAGIIFDDPGRTSLRMILERKSGLTVDVYVPYQKQPDGSFTYGEPTLTERAEYLFFL